MKMHLVAHVADRESSSGWRLLLSATLLLATVHAYPQTVESFNLGAGAYCTVVQADGKILVGGSFTQIAGQTRYAVARLNADGTLDTTFDSGPAIYSFGGSTSAAGVSCMALQPDGKILVAGAFTVLGGQPRSNIARLNADGTLDTAFNPGAGSTVRSLALQADGKILVGGHFSTLSGQPRKFLGRLNADGTLDPSFNPPYYTSPAAVFCVALQDDGKVLSGGDFGNDCLHRLNADGTQDNSFKPRVGYAPGCLAVQADGKILVGGSFSTVGGQTRNLIARLNADGTLDAGFDPGAGASYSSPRITSLVVQSNGKILVAGMFTTLAGQARNNFGRLNADGTLDTNFNAVVAGSGGALAVQADGKILLGTYDVYRLSTTEAATESLAYDGTTISWLRGGASPEVWRTTFERSADRLVWTPLGNGTRIPGGWQLAGVSLPAGTAIRAQGHVSGGANNGSAWYVQKMIGPPGLVTQPVNRTNVFGTAASFYVVAAGTAPLAYQWFRDGVALTNAGNISGVMTPSLTISNVRGADEAGYSVVVSNTEGGITSLVATLEVDDPGIISQPASQKKDAGQSVTFSVSAAGTAPLTYQWWKDGVLLAGATGSTLTLTSLQGRDSGSYCVVVTNGDGRSATSASALLAVNLCTVDNGFNPGADSSPYALAVQVDGKILAGGPFTTLGGQTRKYIGRLNADGALDTAFNPGANGYVYSLAVQADGKILVGGSFTMLGGQARTNIARLNPDGTLDSRFNPGAGAYVNSLALQADGKILVGGGFHSLGGQTRERIGRLNPDGTIDAAFNPGADLPVVSLAVQADGRILVAGTFHVLGGQWCYSLGRLNADGTHDSAFQPGSPGVSAYVNAVAVQADGKILAGGSFTVLGGQPRNCIARFNADGSLDEAFDPGLEGFAPCVYSLAVQADGKILAAGTFNTLGGRTRHNIARLNADGTVDATFDSEASYTVTSLAVQTDGKILAGGSFTMLGGQPRSNLGRLNNSETASQNLVFEGPTITWLRGGTGPEVWRTTLEHSTAGGAWSGLGTGKRTPWGWQWTNASVPVGATIRARGQATGGYRNGSGWFVETNTTTRSPSILLQPASRTDNPGTIATFSVLADGTPTLNYQWRKDGADLTWATASTLSLTNVQEADQGVYSVVVSNSFGSVVSSNALLKLNHPPVARCRNAIVSAGANCLAEASVDNGSFDPDGDPITLSQSPQGPYLIGTNLVALIVTDGLGLSNSCAALVIVLDTTAPEITPPASIVASSDLNQCGAVVTFQPPTVTDLCSAMTTILCTPPSGSFFPAGITTVQCAATDAAGNMGLASFTVTVRDDQPPLLACPADILVTNAHAAWTSTVTFSPKVSDNCPGVGLPICIPPSGSPFVVGTNLVQCSVTDAAGNTSQGSFRVSVLPGNQPPVPVIRVLPLDGRFRWGTRPDGRGGWTRGGRLSFSSNGEDNCDPNWCGPSRSRTNLLVIACNRTNATVICDGSKSYDPDDASFNFSWFNGTNHFSTNKVAVTVLSLGTNVITLFLDDTFPLGTNSASVNVEVLSPGQAVRWLLDLVENSGLPPRQQRPLSAILNAAIAAMERGNLNAGLTQLGAFQHLIQAQVRRSDPTLADTLCQAAQQIVEALAWRGLDRHRGEARSLTHLHGGKFRLGFMGSAGQVHLVQASTNLVNWDTIGVAVDHGDGSFEFEDADAVRFPSRYYRLLSP